MVSIKSLLHRRARKSYYPVITTSVDMPTPRNTLLPSKAHRDRITSQTLSLIQSLRPMPGINPAANFPHDHVHQRAIGIGSESKVDLWSHRPTGYLLVVKSLRTKTALPYVGLLPNEVHVLKDLPLHDQIVRLEAFYAKVGKQNEDCVIYEHMPGGDLFPYSRTPTPKWKNGVFSETFMWNVFRSSHPRWPSYMKAAKLLQAPTLTIGVL